MSWTQFNSEFPKTELSWASFFARIHEGLLRDSWRIVGWIGQYFKCCNWNFNVARKVFAKKSLPNIFSRNQNLPKNLKKQHYQQNRWNKSDKKYLTKIYQKIFERESRPNNPWRKTRANISLKKNTCKHISEEKPLPRKLSQTVFEATNLPKKSEETSLPTKLLKQISNKKSLQRSFYQTNLEKHSQQKTQKTLSLPNFEEKPLLSNLCRKIFDTKFSSQ